MRIVTYNIQWGKGRDQRVDLDRIARTVEAADLIALQEVERNWRDGPLTDQVARFQEMFSDRYLAFGMAVDIDGSRRDATGRVENRRRQYGNLVVSRWPILATRTLPLPKYPVLGHVNDSAMLLETIIDHPGRALRFYTTHLNYLSQRQRLLQTREVLRFIADAPSQGGPIVGPGAPDSDFEADWMALARKDIPAMPNPAVLVGDFNMCPDAPEYALITGPADPEYGRLVETTLFADALALSGMPDDEGITFPTDDGKKLRIDHIFVSGDLVPTVKRAWIDNDADGSDHQPVWAELDLDLLAG
jgi:endonuclease/exonuclease/phosphatase family metal-dependent hydrolase